MGKACLRRSREMLLSQNVGSASNLSAFEARDHGIASKCCLPAGSRVHRWRGLCRNGPAPLQLGRVTGLSRTGQQGRASVGRGWLPPRPPGSRPPLLCSGGLGALVSPLPRDWRPADGGGALEFIIQASLPEGASLPDTALSESWEWLAEPIC